jgi:flagellar hook-associated protein 2
MNLQTAMGQLVSSATPGNPNVLYAIGITAGADGTLSISDTAKFDDALAVNSTKVSDLFNSSNGVAVKLKTLLSGYVATKGQMDAANTTLSSQITNLDSRIKAAQARITQQVARYRSDFTRLQSAVDMATQQLTQIQTILAAVTSY